MLTPWKIIFNYTLGSETNSQTIYDGLFKLALNYKLRKHGLGAIPVDNKILTDAIFDLNSHDKIDTPNRGIINGQDLKELFITTIFLKHLETKFTQQSKFFIVLPQDDTSCDTAVLVAEPNAPLQQLKEKEIKFPEKHTPLIFQIKEYVDFQRLNNDALIAPAPIDIEKLGLIVDGYSDYILVFMRDFSDYSSDDLKEFFKKNPKCFLISFANDIKYIPDGEKEYRTVPLDPNKHNYAIELPKENTLVTVSFSRPSCLVELPKFKINH